MKNMAGGVLFCVVALAASALNGGQEPTGVSGVNVVVKQSPGKHAVTDVNGKFTLAGLSPGSYTLSFRARPSDDRAWSTKWTRDKVIVATEFLVKIEGDKNSVTQGLNSDRLLAGVDIAVKVGPGAPLRGQVLAGDAKKWVWVPTQLGSNLAGHWAVEGTEAASAHNIIVNAPKNFIYR